ncbi:MAG: DUF935 family protein [Candidatus Riesia sp.]|nr:DUF935 family protein [Candidatus Riesia sp.]
MGFFDFLRKKPTAPENKTALFSYENVNRMFDYYDYISDPIQYFAKIPDRKKLRELYYDDEISSAIDTRMETAISSEWTLEGGSDEVNAFIYENLTYGIEKILSYSWWSVAYGYSVFQIVYELENSKVYWGEIYDQPFDAFKVTRQKELYSEITKERYDPFKFFLTVNKPTYYNPMGEPLLAKLYYPFYFKCNGWDFYMKFMERWGAPFIHGKTDLNNDQLKKQLQKLGESKRPTSLITPKDVELNVIEGSTTGAIFDEFTRAINERIQRLVLGGTLTATVGQVGSLALGEVHNEVRKDKVKSDCQLMAKTVQDCIDKLFILNGFTGDIPQFYFVDPKGLQSDRAERDVKLRSLGVSFNDKYFIENYDLNPEHFEIKEPDTSILGFMEDNTLFKDAHLHNCKFANDSDPLVKAQMSLENEMIELSRNAFSKEELRVAIKSAKNPKDLQDKLAILMEKDSGNFEDVLTKALYMAKEMGFVNGKESIPTKKR